MDDNTIRGSLGERFLARRFPARRGRARGARARAAARRARALRRDPRGRGGVEDRGYGSHDVARACVRFVVPRASADDSRPRRRLDPTIEASSQLSEREKTRELFAFLGGAARARARDATRRETRCQTAIPTPRWTSRRTWATARPPGIGTRVAERVAERARISRSRRSFKPTTRTVLSADIHPRPTPASVRPSITGTTSRTSSSSSPARGRYSRGTSSSPSARTSTGGSSRPRSRARSRTRSRASSR